MKSCIVVLIMVSCLVMTESIEWKAEDVTNLFTLMKKYGKDELDNWNKQLKENNSPLVSQYLVATVLSENEIKYTKETNKLPDSVKQNNNRIKVIFNDKNYKNFPYKTKKPLHGEVLMLLDHQDIPHMTKTLREYHQDKNTYPFVVLYSHYIPCSDVKGVEYSCAEELANDAIVNHGKYKMLVGYKDIFHGTAKDNSVEFMQIGGIELFQFEQNKLISVPSGSKPQPGIKAKIFQDLFYKCLDLTPISEGCCTVDKYVQNKLTKQSILSLFVNTVVYFCTTGPLNYIKGKFTQFSRWTMTKCIGDYAESHIGNDCRYCNAPSTEYSIKVCGLFASTFGTEVGRPENPNEPFSPKWKEGGPVAWNTLYNGYNVNAAVNRPAIFCLEKALSIQSLCSQLTDKRDKINIKIRDKERLLKKEFNKNIDLRKIKKNDNTLNLGLIDEQKKIEQSKRKKCCFFWN